MKKILAIVVIGIMIINGFGVVACASIKEDKLIVKPLLSPGDHFRFIMHGLRIRSYRILKRRIPSRIFLFQIKYFQ